MPGPVTAPISLVVTKQLEQQTTGPRDNKCSGVQMAGQPKARRGERKARGLKVTKQLTREAPTPPGATTPPPYQLLGIVEGHLLAELRRYFGATGR